jgi:riboflavin biosynthesis pyrimidine reductase
MSLDGRTAMASGESQWITGPAARAAVQRLRAQASVVISGADTVLADQARLTVRAEELGLNAELTALAIDRPPLRVLIDGPLRVPLDAPFFQAGKTLVATCAVASARQRYQDEGHELLAIPHAHGHVDLRKLLQELAGRGNGATQREAFKDRIRDYIGQHLRDPALSLDRIAEVLRCSKRHLHQAFADEEVTLAQFILQRRLQACMRDLRNPLHQPRTITDIAFSWGFNNGAHFSRVFREHAGLSPSDFRAASLAAGALPH